LVCSSDNLVLGGEPQVAQSSMRKDNSFSGVAPSVKVSVVNAQK